MRPMADGKRLHSSPCARCADDQARLGITDEIVQFRKRIGGIEWEVDRPHANTGEIEHQRLGALLHLDGHPIARPNPQHLEGGCETAGLRQHVAIGPRTTIRAQNENRVRAQGQADGIEEMVAHGVNSLLAFFRSASRGNGLDAGRVVAATGLRTLLSGGTSLRIACAATTSPRPANASWFVSMSSSL